MRHYIIKRLLAIIPMLIGISVIMFIIMHLAPGDPTSVRYGLNPEISEKAREAFNQMYDLDKPVLVQYLLWIKRCFLLDFGRSMIDDQSVTTKIFSRLPATLLLQIVSIFFIFLISLPVGIISALKKNSFFDRVTTVLVYIGYAMPTFWLALLLMFLFSFKLQWLPISGMCPWYVSYLTITERFKDLAMHMVLPVSVTVVGSLAVLSRYTRSSVIEVMKEQYVLTAVAKGLSKRRIVLVHILRNALLPIATIVGLMLPALISGSFIIETIFAWPGMGRLGYEAIMGYDYPVVMGVGVIATLLTLLGILISDILYAKIDPRIRYEKYK